MSPKKTIIGPFEQIISLSKLAETGPLKDESLRPLKKGGIVISNGKIEQVGKFDKLLEEIRDTEKDYQLTFLEEPMVLLPGFVDCHTHICSGGSRASDYAMRIAGKSYLEIAEKGGGILDTVRNTRAADIEDLVEGILARSAGFLAQGVTTCEIKSGYGLNEEHELKMLYAIDDAAKRSPMTFIPTCLAAHTKPKEFHDNLTYLDYILEKILPRVKQEQLSNRVDIFIEKTAFQAEESRSFLEQAKAMGFDICIHGDQFSPGGAELGAQLGAVSVDHLESTNEAGIAALQKAGTTAVVLPGASLGLGMNFAPARKLLDGGLSVAISTDWNPGSAPMGDLLVQASLLSAYEKLTTAEVFAGITFRAAQALGLKDRGRVDKGMKADMVAFPTDDYREILYQQGMLRPEKVWIDGQLSFGGLE